MTRGEPSLTEALAPVETGLLRMAHTDAEALRNDADTEVERLMSDARQQADRMISAARALGGRQAQAALAVERTRARRTVRAAELAAQRQVYDQLREQTTAALDAHLLGGDAPATIAAITRRIRDELGPDAVITPAEGGGLIGRTRHRFVDCSAGTLAARAVDALGVEVARLWRR